MPYKSHAACQHGLTAAAAATGDNDDGCRLGWLVLPCHLLLTCQGFKADVWHAQAQQEWQDRPDGQGAAAEGTGGVL